MKEHQNGAGTNGYWVGVKITAPENLKITDYYFAKDEYTEASTLTAEETPVQDESFYVNVGDANEKKSLAVKLSDGSICVYKFDTTGVKKYVVKSAVTTAVTGGTATVTGATELKSVAEGTELTVVANTPALGYVAANPTITVTKTGDADTTVTVTEGKFTMPAYPVTVTVAYAADPTVTVATLNHTAHSQWGSNTPAEGTTDNELERFNLDVDTGWAAVAYMDFDISNIDVNTLYSAELTYKATSAKTYPSAMYYLTGDVDLTTDITGAAADRFTDSRKVVNAAIPSVKDGVTLKQDVSAAVTARKADSKANVIFALTGNSGGASLYGKASTDAPTLVAKKGVPVTFTVTAGEDEKVANAEISVKSGNDVVKTAKTDENGTATIVLLPSTEYTYTVTSDKYAIKKDVALTTTTESSSVAVTLTDNVATTVEIANPATGTTLAQGEEATYTATVKDQDGRVMTATVDWAVLSGDAAAENITVANGKVNVAEEATVGDYKVKATVNGTTVSATADLKVIAAEKLNLSITSQDAEQGTVAYTVNGVTSTATQLNKGKKIVATATPAALYEFVGWVTSTENLITGTYVSTDAQYSFDLTANTTLIAVFKYNGIYYSEDFETYTADTAITAWYNGGTAGGGGASSFKVENENTYMNAQVDGRYNAARNVIHKLDTAIEFGDGIKISYDINIPVKDAKSVLGAEISLGDSSSNNILSVGNYGTQELKYYSGGTMSTGTGTPSWGVNGNVASAVTTGLTTDLEKWYHVELTVVDGKGTLTVTQKDDSTNTKTVSDIEITSTNIQYIRAGVGKITGSNGTTTNMQISLDNIQVAKYTPTSTSETE